VTDDRVAVTPWTPIERQLLESSVWEADPVVRVLWVSVLLIASEPGRNGTVDLTTRSLAARACLSLEDTERALAVLMAPDPQSRSREEDGRRLVPIDPERAWGWRVVTWARRKESRLRAMAALRKQRQRSRDRVTNRDTVTHGHAASPREGEREGEREREREEESEGGSRPLTPRRSRSASPSEKGRPTRDEWAARAAKVFPTWPQADVSTSFDVVEAEGWPRGSWHARQNTLHARFVDRERAATAKLSPAERERAEIKEAAARASRPRAER